MENPIEDPVPKKPKRPSAPFFMFLKDFREDFKKQFPYRVSTRNVSRRASEEWKYLSTEIKEEYHSKFKVQKVQYDEAMIPYRAYMEQKQAEEQVIFERQQLEEEQMKNMKEELEAAKVRLLSFEHMEKKLKTTQLQLNDARLRLKAAELQNLIGNVWRDSC